MKREDLQAITKDLQNIPVHLPLHQKALRERLLATHADHIRTRPRRFADLSTRHLHRRAGLAGKPVLLGIALVTIVVLVGLLLFLPSGQSSSKKFIAQSSKAKPAARQTVGSNTACGKPGSCSEAAQEDHASEGPTIPAATPQTNVSTATNRPDSRARDSVPQERAAPPTPAPADAVLGAVTSQSPAVTTVETDSLSDESHRAPINQTVAGLFTNLHIGDTLTGKDKPKKEKAAQENKTSKSKAAKGD